MRETLGMRNFYYSVLVFLWDYYFSLFNTFGLYRYRINYDRKISKSS
jgi:hypothetical protein